MAEPTVIKPANLERVVRKARDVFASRYRTLDSALLSSKIASDRLSSAEQDYTSVFRALGMVNASITGEAELRSAKDALGAMMSSLESGMSELQSMQGWLAPFEESTSRSLVSLDLHTLKTLEGVLASHLANSHGMLSPIRGDARTFAFTKPPTPQERAAEVLDNVAISESGEDVTGMSVETILSTTFGPLHSAAAILEIGKAYAEHAAETLGAAALNMDSSAQKYSRVHDSIEGEGEFAAEAKKILFGLVERLSMESQNATKMRSVADRVTATVARVLESIDEFTVNALRSALYGQVPEEAPQAHEVEFTPPPVDLGSGPAASSGEAEESQSQGEEAKSTPMTLHDCLSKVADGEIEAVDSFVKETPDQATELIESLDNMARTCDEEADRLNAVKALKILATGDRAVPILTGAVEKLHGLWDDGPGEVKTLAGSCLSDLGTES